MTAAGRGRRSDRLPLPSGSQDAHIEAFLEMMDAERGAAANTRLAYGRDLAVYADFLAKGGRTPLTATPEDLRRFIAKLRRDGGAATSLARRLSALRQLHRFLCEEGLRGDDPTAVIEGPRRPRRLPKTLSEAEIGAILAAASQRKGVEGMRLLALLEVLYAAGLRVSELVGLPLSALAPDRRFLVVRGKGAKERLVPLGDPARASGTALPEQAGVGGFSFRRGAGLAT
jgi:integrase/recombinase XerD